MDLSGFRCNDSDYGSCTIQLDPTNLSAAANDDATAEGAWCPPSADDEYTDANPDTSADRSALGTPGAANRCGDGGGESSTDGTDGTDGTVEVPPDVCQPGDLLLTELMPAPRDSGYNDEWIEVLGTGQACNLHSCRLEASFLDDDGGEVFASTIIDADEGVAVDPGAYTLLFGGSSAIEGTGAPVTWTFSDGVTVSSAYNYRQSELRQRSTRGTVSLSCEEQLIDSAEIAWEDVDEALTETCPDGGYSLNLTPPNVAEGTNDDPGDWCIPPSNPDSTATYADPGNGDEVTIAATPGRDNQCPFYNWPSEGDLAFVEVMGNPVSGTPEWFELYNASAADLEINLCTLRRAKLDYDGNEETVTEYRFTAEDSLSLASGAIQVFVKDQCLATEEEADSEAGAECRYGEILYGSVALTADRDEQLELFCPTPDGETVLVDRMQVNFEDQDAPRGFSLMLDSTVLGAEAASANDDPDAWCIAAPSQELVELRIDDGEEVSCSYGTPGEAGECLVGEVTLPEGPGCMCSASASPRLAWLGLVLPGVVVWRRRRENADGSA